MDNRTEIYLLIEKYFAGDTTLEEEVRLKHLLAACDDNSPEVVQAKAVTGFFAAASRRKAPVAPRRFVRHILRTVSVAASVVIAVILCVNMLRMSPAAVGTDMLAYIGGVEVEDEATIMNIIQDDFDSLREAILIISEERECDFLAINEVMNP